MGILIIAAFIVLSLYVTLLLKYAIGWRAIPSVIPGVSEKNHSTFISVVIPARNEESKLSACLESILAQTYPRHLYEILLVDDFSTDNTAAIARSFGNAGVKLISLCDFVNDGPIRAYKKKAIEVAIGQSEGTLIVTTDADCVVPEKWLASIAGIYEASNPVFIAAPVAINCSLKFIEIFQALDFMSLQGITAAAVHNNVHSMCNGANLAYEKSAFYAVNGFEGINDIASGDDMLLMHKINTRFPGRLMYLKSRDAIVQTAAVTSIAAFFNQRIRWASKAGRYNDKSIMPVLFVVYFLNIFLLVIPIFAAINNPAFPFFCWRMSALTAWVILLLIKTITELIFLCPVAYFFNKQRLLWLFPLMQPWHILYTIIAGWLGKFGSYDWKDRKVT